MVADINSWNDQIVAEFRGNAGHVAWSSDEDLAAGRPVPSRLPAFRESPGVPIILVHHVGVKTGKRRINPVLYQLVGEDFAIFASYGGSRRHPAWYHNLLANPRTTVEIGASSVLVSARLAEGAERERIWAKQVALVPEFADFEDAAGRQLPIVVLQRRGGSRATLAS